MAGLMFRLNAYEARQEGAWALFVIFHIPIPRVRVAVVALEAQLVLALGNVSVLLCSGRVPTPIPLACFQFSLACQ